MPELSALLELFLKYQQVERSASRHTLVNYRIDLLRYVQFLERLPKADRQKQLGDFKVLRRFLSQETKEYEPSTVARRLSAIKSFLKFLHREGHLPQNTARLIPIPKIPEKLPLILKEQEILLLLEQVEGPSFFNLRTKAILELLYSTGMRVSELIGLRQSDLNLRGGEVKVLGKGEKERILPLGRPCQTALRTYLESLPPGWTGPSKPLFYNDRGERLAVRTVQKNIQKVALEALGPKGKQVTPHTFRHSCASHLLARGAGLREIQELLGHETLMTTQKYTQVDLARLKAAYQAAHPRSKE